MNTPAAIASDLPPALKPWRSWLGWFDAELAEHLGDLLLRLSTLVGPAPAIASRAALEPDGLDDLRSRGSYERLLSSEWLLADELPEEFLRRAAAAEHLFLAPRLRGARVERSVLAVFDCGPRQLGGPRLAHLAAWILLARRAAEGGGTLHWGVLHSPGMPFTGQSADQLNALLGARTLIPGNAEHVAGWRAAAAGIDAEVETWWIGPGLPANTPPPGRHERVLTLRTGLDATALEIALTAGAQTRRTGLALPPDRAATALLRGQFSSTLAPATAPAIRHPKTRRLSLVKAPLLSMPAGFVGVATLEGHAMQLFSLPRPGGSKPSAPRIQQWSSARPPIAMTLAGRQAAALCSDGDTLHFWQIEGFGTRPKPAARQFEASIATAHWLPMIRLAHGKERRVCVIDSAGRLVAWDGRGGKHIRTVKEEPAPVLPTVFGTQVLAMLPLDSDRLAYAFQHEGSLWLRMLGVRGTPSALTRPLCTLPGGKLRVFMSAAAPQRGRIPAVRALAVCGDTQAQTWRVCAAVHPRLAIDAPDGCRQHEIRLGPRERVFGVLDGFDGEMPALIVRGADRCTLFAVTPGGRTLLHSGTHKIEQCTVCPHTGLVALLTSHRELLVVDARLKALVLAVRDADTSTSAASHDD